MGTLGTTLEETVTEFAVEYRVHATRRMFERGVLSEDVERVLESGQVIERYEDTPPFRHVLLSGKSSTGHPLHVSVVVHLTERILTVVTVYEPDASKWTKNFSRRKP